MKPKLNPNGSEILDLTPVAMPVSKFQSSNDMDLKLKAMVAMLLEERQGITEADLLDDETNWELPNETPENHYSDNMPTKKDLINEFKKFKTKKTRSVDDVPVDRKPAKTGLAKRVESSKQKLAETEQSESQDSDE